MSYEEYINSLKLLERYNYYYYTLDKPIVSDSIYDRLYNKVKKYEEKHPYNKIDGSVTDLVGGKTLDSFKKVKHYSKMYSLDNLFTKEDLERWLTDKDTNIYLDPKYDGVSLNLIYDKGKLIDAITRGDGTMGESVYNNVLNIRDIPRVIDIDSLIEIRGEIVISILEFDRINKENKKKGLPLYSNPRNLAAGTLRQLDPNIVKERKLMFYPYNIGVNDLDFKYQIDITNFFIENDFNKPIDVKVVKGLENIEQYYNKINDIRPHLKIPLDGVVLKINDLSKHEEYGYTNKYPLHSIAYKFPAVEFLTKILDIRLQVSRFGVITPVAIIEDTLIDGVNVTRATLHNFNEINRKDIRIGDTVIIIRSGDVIPKILRPIQELRTDTIVKYKEPEVCPCCNSRVIKNNSDVVCTNKLCKNRVIEKLTYFVSKDGLDIPDMSKQTIVQLYEILDVREYVDILRLTKDDLLRLDGFSDVKINKLYNNIHGIYGIEYWRFINSLGIANVGLKTSKDISRIIKDSLVNIDVSELRKINGIGDNVYSSIIDYINEYSEDIVILENILKPKLVNNNGILNSLNITITGKIPISRNLLIAMIEDNGGIYNSSVIKTTDILVSEEKSGKKYNKAISNNIDVLTYQEFKNKYKL